MRILLLPGYLNMQGENTSRFIHGLKEAGHEVVYWQSYEDKDKLKPIFKYVGDNKSTGEKIKTIGQKKFPPPCSEEIREYYQCQLFCHGMRGGYIGGELYENKGLHEKKHDYYQLLGQWLGFLKYIKPDLIIFSDIPHKTFKYVIYCLAKTLKIEMLMFEFTWVSDRVIFYNDYVLGSKALDMAIETNKDQVYRVEDLSADIAEYYNAQKEARSSVSPIYMKKVRRGKKGPCRFFWGQVNFARKNICLDGGAKKVIEDCIKNAHYLKKGFITLIKSSKDNIRKEYLSVQRLPEVDENYIYFPLHRQPEKSTLPQGGIFEDQILAIETLAAILPENWKLYVKEHPLQWELGGSKGEARGDLSYSSDRYPGYYRKIAEARSVKVVPIETSSAELIKGARAVATITGKAAWEAVQRGIPALLFGDTWFANCPGVFKVNGPESCGQAVVKISQGFKPSNQDIINFLKSFDQATFHGYIDNAYGPKISRLTTNENMANILKVVISEAAKITE